MCFLVDKQLKVAQKENQANERPACSFLPGVLYLNNIEIYVGRDPNSEAYWKKRGNNNISNFWGGGGAAVLL